MEEDEETARMTSAAYRRQVCFLLSSSLAKTAHDNNDTHHRPLIKEMEMNLGQQCLLKDNDIASIIPPTTPTDESCPPSSLNNNNDPSQQQHQPQLDMRVPPSFLHCMACGSWLQPGHNGTTVRLRSLGRGKTRRRRASRHKAARLRSKQQASVSGGRQWKKNKEEEPSPNTTTSAMKRISASHEEDEEKLMHNVTDGTCRNAIVYTCGTCGTKRKLKGLPVVSNKSKATATAVAATTVPQMYKQQAPSQKKQQGTELKGTAAENNLSDRLDEFVPLSATTTQAQSKPAQQKQQTLPKRLEPRKKKKKPKKPENSSNLLNFLSSLND